MLYPFPVYLVLTILFIPGTILLANGVASASFLRDDNRVLAAPGFAVLLLTITVHVIGLLVRNFYISLAVGTAVTGAVGYALRIVCPKEFSALRFHFDRRTLVVAALCTAPVALFNVFFSCCDEFIVNGHIATTNNILNGAYPPRNIWLPSLDYSYYYGIDLFFACVAAMFRLGTEPAMFLVIVSCWFYSNLLAANLFERITGRRDGWKAIPIVVFCGGLPRLTSWIAGKTAFNPALFLYFQQHPWTFGIPIAFLVMIELVEFEEQSPRLGWIGLLLLFCGLSIYNITLFLTFLPTSLVVLSYMGFRNARSMDHSPSASFYAAAALLVAIPIGMLLTGFASHILSLASNESRETIGISRGGIGGDFSRSLIWNIVSFGVLLPAGVAGLAGIRNLRLFAVVLVGGSVVTVNALQYSMSWDIVKFGAVAYLILGIGAASWTLSPSRNPLIAIVTALLLVAESGLELITPAWHEIVGSPILDARALWRNAISTETSPDDKRAIEWLREHAAPYELVARKSPTSTAYAVLGGLPETDFPLSSYYAVFGVPDEIARRHLGYMISPPSKADALRADDIRWIVVDERAHRGDPLREAATRWLNDGDAILAAQFGPIVVVHLK